MRSFLSQFIFVLALTGFLTFGYGISPVQANGHSPKIASIIQKTMDDCSEANVQISTLNKSDLSNSSNDILHVTNSGHIEITVHSKTRTTEREEESLKALGAEITGVLKISEEEGFPQAGMIQAWVPYNKLDEVAELSWVVAITTPSYGNVNTHPLNPINSEGVPLHNADMAQSQGVTGAGVSIGAISDGVTNLAASQARNELPAVNVVANVGSGDEGTAMLEIIHDMAPGANLMFEATGGGAVNHVNALNALRNAGANVISEDLAFDSEPAFQQGIVAAGREFQAANGVPVHSSSGNRGANHSARVRAVGTGGGPDGFNGPFVGCTFDPNNVVAIAPGGDTTFDIVLGANGAGTIGTSITLQWSEPRAIFPTAGAGGFTDLDLYVMDATGTTCLAESIGAQGNGSGDTIEQISMPPGLAGTSVKIVVDVFGGTGAVGGAPLLDLRWRRSQGGGDATTRAGSNDPDKNYTGLAYSIGAVRASNLNLEGFSSAGPVILESTTVCPGAYPCPGSSVAGPAPQQFQGLDFLGIDRVSVSGVGGFGGGTCPAPNPGGQGQCFFSGTSAAAPHTAACDALVREIMGAAVAPATTRSRLASTATDYDVPGEDSNTGAGLVDCFAALGPPQAQCQNQTVDTDPGVCQRSGVSIDDGSFDPFGDAISLSQNPDNPYPLGATVVDLTVTDGDGLTDSCTATVTVEDNENPTITAPADVTVECTGPSGQAVDIGNAIAGDNCSVMVSNDAPPLFSLGTTTVNWTATDGSNNTAGDSQDVTVVDTTPPEVFCNAPATITPPDAPISFTATAQDACDATVDFSITEFRCFKITNKGRVVDKGESCIVSIDGDTIHIQDSGGIDDHIEWTVFAVDDSGNETTKTCEVLVVKKK